MTGAHGRLHLIDARVRESAAAHARVREGEPVLPEWAAGPGSLDFVYRLPEVPTSDTELRCTVEFVMTAPDAEWSVQVVVQLRLGVAGWSAAEALEAARADHAVLDGVAWPELRNAARAAAATIDVLVKLPGEHPRYVEQMSAAHD